MIAVCTREDGAARHWLVVHSHRVWPECEWLLLPFALPGFWGQFLRRDGVCETVCVEERALEPVREGRKEKGKGGGRRTEREKENRSLWREGGRELQAARLDYRSNTAVFLLLLWGSCLSLLAACLSFLLLLFSLLGHDPGGHLDLLAHLEKRRENAVAEEGDERRGQPHTLLLWWESGN